MSLVHLFIQLQDKLSICTPPREQEKAAFIEDKISNLFILNITEEELLLRIDEYLQYSSQGVFNALAFNNNLDKNVRTKVVNQLINFYFMYSLQIQEVHYADNSNSTIKAYFCEDHNPLIALIISNTDNMIQVIPFVDKEELCMLLQKTVIDDCFKQFENGSMSDGALVASVIALSDTRDSAFETLLRGINYEIDKIVTPLKQEFNLESQLDKLLRSSKDTTNMQQTIIKQLYVDGCLDNYKNTRLSKNSILTNSAQQKLKNLNSG